MLGKVLHKVRPRADKTRTLTPAENNFPKSKITLNKALCRREVWA